jgi:HEAT repeat protein
MGERGRKGLLSLAVSGDVTAVCALNFLGTFREPGALPIARRILADASAPDLKRVAAMWVVARLKDRDSLGALIHAFGLIRTTYDKDSVVMGAADALVEMGDERGVKMVLDALSDPAYRRTLDRLIMCFGGSGNDEAVGPLLRLLRELPAEEAESLRHHVASTLIYMGTPRSRHAGIEVFDAISDPERRAYGKGDLIYALWLQRRLAKTPEEVAEIDGYLDHLGAQRPSLPSSEPR